MGAVANEVAVKADGGRRWGSKSAAVSKREERDGLGFEDLGFLKKNT